MGAPRSSALARADAWRPNWAMRSSGRGRTAATRRRARSLDLTRATSSSRPLEARLDRCLQRRQANAHDKPLSQTHKLQQAKRPLLPSAPSPVQAPVHPPQPRLGRLALGVLRPPPRRRHPRPRPREAPPPATRTAAPRAAQARARAGAGAGARSRTRGERHGPDAAHRRTEHDALPLLSLTLSAPSSSSSSSSSASPRRPPRPRLTRPAARRSALGGLARTERLERLGGLEVQAVRRCAAGGMAAGAGAGGGAAGGGRDEAGEAEGRGGGERGGGQGGARAGARSHGIRSGGGGTPLLPLPRPTAHSARARLLPPRRALRPRPARAARPRRHGRQDAHVAKALEACATRSTRTRGRARRRAERRGGDGLGRSAAASGCGHDCGLRRSMSPRSRRHRRRRQGGTLLFGRRGGRDRPRRGTPLGRRGGDQPRRDAGPSGRDERPGGAHGRRADEWSLEGGQRGRGAVGADGDRGGRAGADARDGGNGCGRGGGSAERGWGGRCPRGSRQYMAGSLCGASSRERAVPRADDASLVAVAA